MDSPSNTTTNVLKIDNLSRVLYAIYEPVPPENSALLKPTHHRIDRRCDILREAERALKAEGVPVLSDFDKGCLWVFYIHGTAELTARVSAGNAMETTYEGAQEGKDERWLQTEKRLKDEWGLKEISTSVFLASSLTPHRHGAALLKGGAGIHSDPTSRLPSTPVTPSIISAPATPGLGPKHDGPIMIDLTLDDPLELPEHESEPISEELIVYGKLMTAFISVVTFCLASREGFTPLNARTLVSPSSLPVTQEYKSQAERTGKEEILPSRPITAPDLVTPLVLELEAYMSSAGTLVVIPHSEKQSSIRRLGTCGLTSASLRNREVFIAPWGEWGRLAPSEEAVDDNAMPKKAEERWKENVMSYLKDQGIVSHAPLGDQKKSVLQEAIEQGKWLNVEIWLRSLTDPSMGDVHRVPWPEALLFLRSCEGDKRTALTIKEKPDFWKLVFDDPEYSQLAWGKLASFIATLDRGDGSGTRELDQGAEWWNVQSAVQWGHEWFKGREERAKKIKESAEVRSKEDRAVGVADKGKGKLVPDTKQGPGVYPTPPDGAAAALVTGGPASTSSAGGADLSIAFATGGDNGMDLDWPGDPTAAHGAGLIPQRETDLFGDGMDDMDIMVGVTEDDFDFFDNTEDFGDGDDGAGGMDLDGSDMHGGGGMMSMGNDVADLRMDTPPPIQNNAPDASNIMPARRASLTERNKKRPRVTVPPELKEVPPVPDNQVRTPPLSPHRAIGLLVPGYQPPTTNGTDYTPPGSGGFKKPSTSRALKGPPISTPKRRMSMYSPILFAESVEMADQKYAPGGRFFLAETVKDEPKEANATRIGKPLNLKRKRIGGAPASETATTPAVEDSVDDDEPEDSSSDRWESDDDSEESDADDTTDDDETYHTSPDRGAQLGFLTWGQKRKWPPENGVMDVDTPEGFPQRRDVAIDVDGEVEVVPDTAPPPWRRMRPDPLDESVVGVFEDMSLTSEPLTLASLGDAEFLDVATVVAGQLTGWVHNTWSGKNETTGDDDEDEETSLIRRRCGRDQSMVENAVKTVFREGAVVRCNLETYAAIADSIQEPPPIPPPPPLGHLTRMPQAKPNISQRRNRDPKETANKSWDIFFVPPPHVRLQRGDNVLEMLPPALYFWETFSLAPISGSKNVISFCFHPASSALKEGADFLLERVSSSYEAGRFGVHVRAEVDGAKNGLVPIELPADDTRDYENGIKAILSRIENFGSVIANGVADEGMNVVIYVINPFSHPAALVDIATSFVRMQKVYEACIATLPEAKPNHLVLQIVPAHFVAHKLGAVMRVGIVRHLAVEVYSRCIPTDPGIDYDEAKRVTSPPITLARPIPKTIEFRLTADPSPALLKENQLLHIAYAQSADERWVAVAWSDPTGSLQKYALINLGRRGTGTLRCFSEAINEMWEATTELIRYPAVKWRLCIAKVCSSSSTMPEDEASQWHELVKKHERVSASYLVSANLRPPYRVADTLGDVKMDAFWPTQSMYSTPPVNTPTPTASGAIVSPEATAATPTAAEAMPELDADAELVDAVDESWGVLLGHWLPDRGESGMLIRRDGGEEGGGWRVGVVVSVVSGGGKEVVREVLEAWRGLGVVGSFMGGTGGVAGVLGWCRGVESVARVM